MEPTVVKGIAGNRLRREKRIEVTLLLGATTSILAVIVICCFLFLNGIPAMFKIGIFNFLFGREWSPNDIPPAYGIFPMILGSIYVTGGAILLGVPLGILTAIFLAFYCPGAFYQVLRSMIELMAGIPSIIYGFFGLVILVPAIRYFFPGNGNSILTASILLGIMILPTVVSISETSLRAVPDVYYEGARALGSSHEQAVFKIVLPTAKSGVLAAIVLAIGRAIGETMAVVMVAGNQARMPAGIFKGIRTLTANIVIEMGYAADLHREALIATGVVLFIFILLTNVSFTALKRRARGL